MSFVDAIKSCFRNYAKFRGRAGRSEYWWFFLFTVLAQTVASSISDDFGNLVGLAVFLPGLAVHVRRMHDTGRSGWWVGAFYGSIVVVIVSVVVLIASTRGVVRGDAERAAWCVRQGIHRLDLCRQRRSWRLCQGAERLQDRSGADAT
ncbi:MAG: DUF805 domain-containing protein [Actinobacteria bacterium]|nr:DUF805 domain-containing protein [Actinomycetota bacterium]